MRIDVQREREFCQESWTLIFETKHFAILCFELRYACRGSKHDRIPYPWCYYSSFILYFMHWGIVLLSMIWQFISVKYLEWFYCVEWNVKKKELLCLLYRVTKKRTQFLTAFETLVQKSRSIYLTCGWYCWKYESNFIAEIEKAIRIGNEHKSGNNSKYPFYSSINYPEVIMEMHL